jgi:membrane-associated protease RseP (regulator of RpoE activity)
MILQPKILVRPRGVDAAVFRIDTGFTGTGRFDSDLTNLLRRAKGIATTGITDEALLGNGAVERVAFERCLELEVAGHRHADLIISQGKANTLGLGFLRRHRVTLDFVNEKAYFEPGKDFSLRDRRDYDGIVVDHEMVVQGVVPGSVAEKSGLKVSDRLVAVGPKKATVAQWPAIRDLLTTPRATPLVITVVRDGQELAISIPGG